MYYFECGTPGHITPIVKPQEPLPYYMNTFDNIFKYNYFYQIQSCNRTVTT